MTFDENAVYVQKENRDFKVFGVQGCQRYFIILFSEFCLWNTMKNQCNFHWKETQRTKLSDQKLKNCKILQLSSYLYTLHKERMST